MHKAVITGATGAVGTALVKELIKQNIETLVICRENSWRNSRIPESPLVKKVYCDLKDLANFKEISEKDYDVFYHFAWEGTTGDARNDMYLQNNNVKYTLDATNLAKKLGCRLFIGAGSQAEYGRFEGVLASDTPAFPETGYGIAKLCAGQMSRLECSKLSIDHIWVRILSVYGPNDTENSMVMSAINKLKNNVTPQFTKGEQKWDYLYSEDAARAFFLLGEKGISGKTYVLGSGKARELKDYITAIQNIVNPSCSIILGAVPYSDKQVMHLEADIAELTKDTGFVPEIEFEDGIRLIVDAIN